MKNLYLPSALCLLALSCTPTRPSLEVEVSNSGDVAAVQTVELDARAVLDRLGAAHCIVLDPSGAEIPSQITHDSLLIFTAEAAPGATLSYTVEAADSAAVYPAVVSGRIYPERADDIAWENETSGFRLYGPTTQARGERAFGYDLFFKHATPDPILETLYGVETDPATWAKVDSLRDIDPALAEEYIASFSYHIDHGLGMDCYAVGPTLGAGVAVPVDADTLCYAWCYSDARVLDNGPVRFTVDLTFAPRTVGTDTAVVETRRISLDSRAPLNHTKVHYSGLSAPRTIAMGFPRRDDSGAVLNPDGVISYADPTQGPDNGKAYLGLVLPAGFERVAEADGHILGYTTLAPADTLDYYWGFVWNANEPDITVENHAARLAKRGALEWKLK
ncbi:MAG: DUF4861 domain-containing protein [Muribaculaceae bacterium]|nr:DUF4861 domain-containing protein [Muribaculaceae bacterium]